jgi:hypothetical protein
MGPSLNPIHRIATGIDVKTLEGRVQLISFPGDLMSLAREVADRGPGTIGFCTVNQSSVFQVEADLDTAWLQSLLEEFGGEISYEHDLGAVEKAIDQETAAFIVAPIPVAMVAESAAKGKRMPPKTTLFWPKPLSGLLMRDISGSQIGGQLS